MNEGRVWGGTVGPDMKFKVPERAGDTGMWKTWTQSLSLMIRTTSKKHGAVQRMGTDKAESTKKNLNVARNLLNKFLADQGHKKSFLKTATKQPQTQGAKSSTWQYLRNLQRGSNCVQHGYQA
eukprot:g78554.t1